MKTIMAIVFIVPLNSLFSQDWNKDFYNPPVPHIGWDSLKNRILYPELAQRAGLQSVVWTRIRFDTTGHIDSILTETDSELFGRAVKKALLSTQWNPPTWKGHISIAWFSIPVFFVLTNDVWTHPLMIETERFNGNVVE